MYDMGMNGIRTRVATALGVLLLVVVAWFLFWGDGTVNDGATAVVSGPLQQDSASSTSTLALPTSQDDKDQTAATAPAVSEEPEQDIAALSDPAETPAEQSADAAPEPAPAPAAEDATAPDDGAGTEQAPPAEAAAPADQDATEADTPAETAEAEEAPRFDIVRVEADGQTVVAGHARPETEVQILLDGEVVAEAKTDRDGAFVTVIFAALTGESHQLQVRMPVKAAARSAGPGTGQDAGSTQKPAVWDQQIGQTSESDETASGTSAEDVARTAKGAAAQDDLAVAAVDGDEAAPAGPTGGTRGLGIDLDALSDPTADAGQDATADASASQSPASGAAEQALSQIEPQGARNLPALSPGADVATPSVSGRSPSTPDSASPGQLAALVPSADAPALPAVKPRAGASPAAPSPQEEEQQFVLSEPVIILPRNDGEAAPVLVLPGSEEVAVLQPAERAPDRVALDRITYGSEGALQLAGRAEPGKVVRIYGNGALIATEQTGPDGQWNSSVVRESADTLNLLRFDEVGVDGQVTSRIETPFEYSEFSPQVVRERQIVIQRGDILWRIAEQFYGDGLRYSLIYGANSELIRDPDLIYPGQEFSIPELVDAN